MKLKQTVSSNCNLSNLNFSIDFFKKKVIVVCLSTICILAIIYKIPYLVIEVANLIFTVFKLLCI